MRVALRRKAWKRERVKAPSRLFFAVNITAIIPTYNRARFLPDALAGLAAQTRPVAEIIVWDDGSTDGTEALCQPRAAAGEIRYFRAENAGKSRALNRAMAEATGEAIWICDDDDIALPDAAETLAAMLDAVPERGLAAGSYRRFSDEAPDVALGPGYWPDLSTGTPLRHILEDIFLFQNATLVRRGAYDRVGPFREDLARSIDYEMLVRLALAHPVGVTERALFRQRKHAGVRGPSAALHAAAQSDAVWKTTDRDIFRSFRERLSPALFEAFFDAEPAPRARAARLQRAAVFARRTDWPAALEDLTAAAEALPEAPLSSLEHAICRRAMAGKHGVAEVMAPDTAAALRRLAKASPAGGEIARALLRGLAWRLKAAAKGGQLREAAALTQFAARLSLAAQRRAKGSPPTISERAALPASFYADT